MLAEVKKVMAISFMPIIIVVAEEDGAERVSVAIDAMAVPVVDTDVDIVVPPGIDMDMLSMLICCRNAESGYQTSKAALEVPEILRILGLCIQVVEETKLFS